MRKEWRIKKTHTHTLTKKKTHTLTKKHTHTHTNEREELQRRSPPSSPLRLPFHPHRTAPPPQIASFLFSKALRTSRRTTMSLSSVKGLIPSLPPPPPPPKFSWKCSSLEFPLFFFVFVCFSILLLVWLLLSFWV